MNRIDAEQLLETCRQTRSEFSWPARVKFHAVEVRPSHRLREITAGPLPSSGGTVFTLSRRATIALRTIANQDHRRSNVNSFLLPGTTSADNVVFDTFEYSSPSKGTRGGARSPVAALPFASAAACSACTSFS